MDTSALTVWHSCLHASTPDRRSALLRCLSPELSAELLSLPVLSIDWKQGAQSIEEELVHIHFSWLAPFLRALPETEIKLLLSALTMEQIKGLKQALLLTNTLPSLTSIGSAYLRKALFDMLPKEDLIPAACLPTHPLNYLLELSLSELYSLIDLLSMHDLSIEIRHIIETAKLKQIHSLLSKAQMTFLKTLLHKKETVSFKKMGLPNWKGDKEALRSMLLQRGVNRIAKALYGTTSSLLWYIAHRLDTQTGELLIKLCKPLDHPHASDLLSEQVVELAHALKTSNPPESI